MGKPASYRKSPAQYDVNSLARGKVIEGLVLLILGTGGFIAFLASLIANLSIESDLHSYGVFPEFVFLGCILFLTSAYMMYEGVSTISQAGLTPFWKCSDKRVRRFYIAFGSSKHILSSMALYDLEPEVRDLALEKLDAETIINTYLKAKKDDSFLYIEKIEGMITFKVKAEEELRIASRTGGLSNDSASQLEDILIIFPVTSQTSNLSFVPEWRKSKKFSCI